MSSMYSLPPYMSPNEDPIPSNVVYSLPSYHKARNGEIKNDSLDGLTFSDPVQLLEKKQLELIASLTAYGRKIAGLLERKGKTASVKKENSTNKTEDVAEKKDKNAKKEERKNAKQDAKAKVASGAKEATPTTKDGSKNKRKPVWTIKEARKEPAPQSLEPCRKAELAKFTTQDLGEVKLIITNEDLPWVAALSRIGTQRSVAFPGKVGNNVTNAKTSVTVQVGDSFSASFKEGTIKSRVTAWKLLGSALGLYSFDPALTVQSAHQHQWLQKADRILKKELDEPYTVREMSQYLSRFDSLGSRFEIGVADIVFRSLLHKNQANGATPCASNIELWMTRIDSV